MCEICQRKNCPPRCPNHSSHSRKLSAVYGSCAKCGSIIHYGEVSFRKSGLLVCNDCHTTLYKKQTSTKKRGGIDAKLTP